jgi:hypothetical protein
MTLAERIARAMVKAFADSGEPAYVDMWKEYLPEAEALLKEHEEENGQSLPYGIGWPPIGEDCLIKPLTNTIVEVKLNQNLE